jgi:hypothetical protein
LCPPVADHQLHPEQPSLLQYALMGGCKRRNRRTSSRSANIASSPSRLLLIRLTVAEENSCPHNSLVMALATEVPLPVLGTRNSSLPTRDQRPLIVPTAGAPPAWRSLFSAPKAPSISAVEDLLENLLDYRPQVVPFLH